jgi:hypothetical protein
VERGGHGDFPKLRPSRGENPDFVVIMVGPRVEGGCDRGDVPKLRPWRGGNFDLVVIMAGGARSWGVVITVTSRSCALRGAKTLTSS